MKLLSVPYRLLFPLILLACAIGAFSTNNNMFDVWVAVVFGLLGYVFIKLGCEPAPLLLGYILGPLLEENLRRALVLSRGDFTVFVTRPISLVMLLIAASSLSSLRPPSFARSGTSYSPRSRNAAAAHSTRVTRASSDDKRARPLRGRLVHVIPSGAPTAPADCSRGWCRTSKVA